MTSQDQAGPSLDPTADTPATAAELDAAVKTVAGVAPGWAASDLDTRLALLEQARGDLLAAAEDWVVDAQVAKGISRHQRATGEAWLTGPAPVARNLRLLHRTLLDIVTTDRPRPADVVTRQDGRTVVRALPTDLGDRVLLPGATGDIVLREGVTPADLDARIGHPHRPGDRTHAGEVAVVLGAGNLSSIPPMDVLTQLYGHLRTVVLKLNPVNDWLGPHVERAFRAFVDADLLRIVHGGADVGARLIAHDDVDAIHLTGSDATHDAIVFGTGDQAQRRKAADEPISSRAISSELGNVTPVIVVPGPWSREDLAEQGDSIASMAVNNAGFNCVTARIVVTHAHWNRRGRLLDAIRASLADAEDRAAYYPGAAERQELFVGSVDNAEGFGGATPGSLPFVFLPDLDEHNTEQVAFTREAFCGVLGEVGLDAPRSVVDYLDAAVNFVNEVLWGTLAATILVHPRSLEDPTVADAVEAAIDRLAYGTIVVNDWPGLAYGTGALPWGGAPGQARNDIQSGRGFVHNTWLVDDEMVDKSVLRTPFHAPVKRITSHTHGRSAEVGRLLTEYEATGRRSLLLPRIALAGLRG